MVLADPSDPSRSHRHQPPVRTAKHRTRIINTPSLGLSKERGVFAWFVAQESVFLLVMLRTKLVSGNVPGTLKKGEQRELLWSWMYLSMLRLAGALVRNLSDGLSALHKLRVHHFIVGPHRRRKKVHSLRSFLKLHRTLAS